MTPKEKANDLIIRFKDCFTYVGQLDADLIQDAKDCAMLFVDETIYNEYQLMCSLNLHDPKNIYYSKYWGEVRKELESF